MSAQSVERMVWSMSERDHSTIKDGRRGLAHIRRGRFDSLAGDVDMRGPGDAIQEKAAIVVVRKVVAEILTAEHETASAVFALVRPRYDLRTDAARVLLRRSQEKIGASRVVR